MTLSGIMIRIFLDYVFIADKIVGDKRQETMRKL